MQSRREEALVGTFVLVVAALLIATVFLLSGGLGRGNTPYRAYFKNAGGLAPGSEVHYAGGPPIGRVQKVASDPQNPTRMEIDFTVDPDTPVKVDSVAEVTSNSPLGDNFLGILPGTLAAPKAPAGATLKSLEYTSFADITALIGQLEPTANQLLVNLNSRAVDLKVSIDRVNDLLGPKNQANIAGSLDNLHGMLAENRPAIHSAINNVDASTAKLGPLIDDFRKTSAQADDALAHLDAMVGEDRPDIHKAVIDLRESLDSAVSLTGQLDRTVDSNAENLDEIIDNMRAATANLNEFTETIKTRPYTLLRSPGLKPRLPGQAPPK